MIRSGFAWRDAALIASGSLASMRETIGVSMIPGQIALMRIPFAACCPPLAQYIRYFRRTKNHHLVQLES
jgi:hypothetical protein